MVAPESNPTVTQPAGSPGGRVLLRSRHDRVIGGVCGGLGRYFGVEPVLIRIVFVVLTVAGGSGVLAYLLAWLLIPAERPGDGDVPAPRPTSASASVVVGALLVAAGTAMLLDQAIPGFRRVLGPLVLIVVGLTVLLLAMRR